MVTDQCGKCGGLVGSCACQRAPVYSGIWNDGTNEEPASKGREIAEAHADWLFSLLRKVYVEAMEHGYKHGCDDMAKRFNDQASDDYADSMERR